MLNRDCDIQSCTLLSTGIICKSLSNARKKFDTVCAWTPCMNKKIIGTFCESSLSITIDSYTCTYSRSLQWQNISKQFYATWFPYTTPLKLDEADFEELFQSKYFASIDSIIWHGSWMIVDEYTIFRLKLISNEAYRPIFFINTHNIFSCGPNRDSMCICVFLEPFRHRSIHSHFQHLDFQQISLH